MGQISQELPFNPQVLRQCREQMNLSRDDVAKKVPSIEQMEEGSKRPTYIQLDKLAKLYEVPRWVFISKVLPPEYHYGPKPSFRRFRGAQAFQDSKVRKLVVRVERYRDLLMELREYLDDAVIPFSAPDVRNLSPREAASSARRWLKLEAPLGFADLRENLEEKSVFIFLTSKYRGWSHIDKEAFRGLCLLHETMPIIIVNDSDARKARSFTLMHELGHLLGGKTSIDSWQESDDGEEVWCNQFAGSVLMPEEEVSELSDVSELEAIKRHARRFRVGPYAFLVRMRQLGRITQEQYGAFENALKGEYKRQREKLQKSKGGLKRNRTKEMRTQFGNPFVRTVLTAWHHKELSVLKAAYLLDIKSLAQLYELDNK